MYSLNNLIFEMPALFLSTLPIVDKGVC